MRTNPNIYRRALVFAAGISLLINLLLVFMYFYGREVILPSEHIRRGPPPLDVWRVSMNFLSNFIFMFVVYVANWKLLLTPLGKVRKLALIISVLIILTFSLSLIFSKIQLSLIDAGPSPSRFIHGAIMRDMFLAVVVVLTTQLTWLSENRQQMALENEVLKTEYARARYQVLKNQVDPHFLFNSLNTLKSLVKNDPERAEDYIQQLSNVFRYALRQKEIITVGDELEFTGAYCHLMKIRYGDALTFKVDVENHMLGCLIIPFSIQLLVENAIKHNVITNKSPLTIRIFNQGDENITVTNPVQPKKESPIEGGIGLTNLSERYRLEWNKEITLRADEREFSVSIPIMI